MSEPGSFRNPVYAQGFPDPFALSFNGRYYAYGTGPAGDGRVFPILSSTDLVHWTAHGGALEAPQLPGLEDFWAPEVAYSEGLFYLYYASGRSADPDHHLRLATAPHPLGPWRDAGLNLTPEECFAIDAHPFRDPADGDWYLFYASDRLEPPFAGTGIVVDRLERMDRLAGDPQPVVRPHSEWQLFERQRVIKARLDWYTVEGPTVVRHGDRYVCFYSGGRWEQENYGVDFAVASHPLGPWEVVIADRPSLLRSRDGVVGPGHNSVVTAPDLATQYLFYHGWDAAGSARYPRLDLLLWRDGVPWCPGPTTDPQPLPPSADIRLLFDAEEPGAGWDMPPGWARDQDGLRAGSGAMHLRRPVEDFRLEVSARGLPACVTLGAVAIRLEVGSLAAGQQRASLPAGFQPGAWHTLRVERGGGRLSATVDGYPTVTAGLQPGPVTLSLEGQGSVFGHVSLAGR